MNKLTMILAAASALAVGAPAAAQYGDSNFDYRITELQQRLQAGVQNGAITRQEAVFLRDQLRELRQLERQFASDGLSGRERDILQQRVQSLRERIRMAERNGMDRGGYDRDDRNEGRGVCPPGLAKKNNGCLPPGQAKRMGDRYDDRGGYNGGGEAARFGFRDTERFIFRQEGGRVLQIDRRTGQVVRAFDIRR
jgi:hypothetical protein